MISETGKPRGGLANRTRKWPRSDSNRGPSDYESPALTAELQGRTSGPGLRPDRHRILLQQEHLAIGRQRPEIRTGAPLQLVRKIPNRVHDRTNLGLDEVGVLDGIVVVLL